MHFDISVIITIRNRDVLRVERLVNSIKDNSSLIAIQYILIDYGSDSNISQELAAKCKDLGIFYHFLNSRGLAWNKSKAINHGVSFAQAQFLLIVDVDMIFESPVLNYCLENYTSGVILLKPYWLDKSGDVSKAVLGDEAQVGGFQFLEKKIFLASSGYNEAFEYWGGEDTNFIERVRSKGYSIHWMDSKVHKMYHVWHEKVSQSDFFPDISVWENSRISFFDYAVINGYPPLMANPTGLINERQLTISSFRNGIEQIPGGKPEWRVVMECLQNKTSFYFDVLPIYVKTSAKFDFIRIFIPLFNWLVNRCGFSMVRIKNDYNINSVYHMLRYLSENNYIDFYLDQNKGRIFVQPI